MRWWVEASGAATTVPSGSTVSERGRAIIPRGFDSGLMAYSVFRFWDFLGNGALQVTE